MKPLRSLLLLSLVLFLAAHADAAPVAQRFPTPNFSSYITPEIDLTVTGKTVLIPGIAGKTFIPYRYFTASITQLTGTATAAGSITIGNNTTSDNLFNATFGSNFIANGWVNGGPASLNMTNFTFTPLPVVSLPNADLVINVTTAVTGPSVAKARFYILGFWQ